MREEQEHLPCQGVVSDQRVAEERRRDPVIHPCLIVHAHVWRNRERGMQQCQVVLRYVVVGQCRGIGIPPRSCLVTEKARAISALPASGISGIAPVSAGSRESRFAISPAGPKKTFTPRRSGPGCHRGPGHVPRGPRPGRAPRIQGTRCGRHGRCHGLIRRVRGERPVPPVPHRNRRLPR